MAWYDFITGNNRDVEEKLNPSQFVISRDQGLEVLSRENITNYRNAYEQLEVVNRAVNMIVDDAAEIPFDVGTQIQGTNPVMKNLRRTRVDLLLNKEPNPFQDISTFKRNLLIDLLIDANIFIYYVGEHLYALPEDHMTLHSE